MNIELNKFEQLKATGVLPSPKGAALTIVRLAQRDDVSASQLEQAIKSDPAFVGRLLKTANIKGRESGRPIASVPDAVNVLGLSVVRNLALGFSLVSNYRSGTCAGFDYSAFWTRAIVNALALQSVVRRTQLASPEESFCCGLLADIGKLALITVHPKEYALLLGRLAAGNIPDENYDAALRTAEIEAFALHHDDLTAAMLTDWGFPRALLEPVYFRHNPEDSSFARDSRGERLLGAVRLADVITSICLAEPDARPVLMATLAERAQVLQLESEVLESIVDGVVRDWREWSVLLQLDIPAAVPAYSSMLEPKPEDVTKDVEAFKPALRLVLAGKPSTQRNVLRDLLLALGYEVFESDTGQRAIELVVSVQAQIVIADWQMPGLDGIQLTRALREMRTGRGMYIVILSEQQDEDHLLVAFEAGADDCLSKPVSDKVLSARLRAANRLFSLQEEVQHDHEEMSHFAAELAVSNRRLHEASVTDPLTGFYNRRYAMDRIEKDWSACGRSGRSLSCVMLDLDNFKQINDTYGHDTGDKVLTGLAAVLKETLRSQDVICRVGGDEFLVICPDSDARAVRFCAERLLAAANALVIEAAQGALRCSISIGVATRSADMINTGMLIKAADEGMYKAKLKGRAQIVGRSD
jgi:diguanylate cyclase (GGDEF)-like protein